MIRVLHIVTHMNRGGLETMIMNYYRNMDRTKIQFDFLTHRDGIKDYDDEIRSLGGKIYHVPQLNPFSLEYRKQLSHFFKNHPEYQIVHSHLDCMSALPLKYAKKAGVKNRIAHAHSTSQDKDLKYVIKRFYMKKINKYATHLFACGKKAGDWMFSGSKFTIINNAINQETFKYNLKIRNKVRKNLQLTDELVVGHVGRFCYPKNHSFIIDIFYDLKKIYPNTILLLIGTGELEDEIRTKVERLGISDSVMFLGLRTDIDHLLNGMDVFLFPSNYEGLPLSIIEAQTNGLPCMISKNVPSECIISENTRAYSLDKTSKEWAVELLKISKQSRQLKSLDLKYDIRTQVDILMNIYMEMIK